MLMTRRASHIAYIQKDQNLLLIKLPLNNILQCALCMPLHGLNLAITQIGQWLWIFLLSVNSSIYLANLIFRIPECFGLSIRLNSSWTLNIIMFHNYSFSYTKAEIIYNFFNEIWTQISLTISGERTIWLLSPPTSIMNGSLLTASKVQK